MCKMYFQASTCLVGGGDQCIPQLTFHGIKMKVVNEYLYFVSFAQAWVVVTVCLKYFFPIQFATVSWICLVHKRPRSNFTCFRHSRSTEMAAYMEGSPNLSVTVTNSRAVRRVMMQPPPAPVPVVHREPYPPYASGSNNYTGINRPQRVSSGKAFIQAALFSTDC